MFFVLLGRRQVTNLGRLGFVTQLNKSGRPGLYRSALVRIPGCPGLGTAVPKPGQAGLVTLSGRALLSKPARLGFVSCDTRDVRNCWD